MLYYAILCYVMLYYIIFLYYRRDGTDGRAHHGAHRGAGQAGAGPYIYIYIHMYVFLHIQYKQIII